MINLRSNYPLLEEETNLFQNYFKALNRNTLQQRLGLPPSRGLAEDREVAAQWLSTQGGQVAGKAVSFCASSHHALVVLAFAAQLQDATIATDPFTYPGMKAIAKLFHLQLVPCETDEDGILPTALEKLCTQTSVQALYVLPTIHNPVGTIMPLRRRQELAEVVVRYQLLIIEDDAYRFLAAEAPARFYDIVPEHTAFIASLTKPVSPALKLAYLVAPPHLDSAIATAIQLTSSGTSSLLSFVASQLILDGRLDWLIARKREEAALRQARIRSMLTNLSVQSHPTSYHVWITLPEDESATDLTQRVLRRGVDSVPGEEYAVAAQEGDGSLRISLGGEPKLSRLEEGIQILLEELHRPR